MTHAAENRFAETPICPVFGRCGACDALDVPYEEQLAGKQDVIEEFFAGMVEPERVRPIKGMEHPFAYRDKIIAPFAPDKRRHASALSEGQDGDRGRGGHKGRGGRQRMSKDRTRTRGAAPAVITGMYAKGTHTIIPSASCPLENEVASSIVRALTQLMRKWDIAAYDEDTGKGFLRHAVIRVGHTSGEVLVTLVTNSKEFPSSRSFCRELVKRVPAITTVVQSINLRKTNVILGEEFRTLYGPGFILDKLGELTFRISAGSFYQVNSQQTEVLYTEAMALAKLTGEQVVIDAYCGTGTLGLFAAKAGAKRVVGVDCVKQAISDARQNAVHNGIDTAVFICGDAAAFMRGEHAAATLDGAQEIVVLMDPPRSGASEDFLRSVVELAPARIVYISCNPKTQARDVAFLCNAGFSVEQVQPVDMFPHTDHIENIVALVRDMPA